MIIELLIAECAVPNAPQEIIKEIIQVESAEDPLAINVNKLVDALIPETTDKALIAAYVEEKVKEGYSVDVGLMQVNSANFSAYSTDAISMLDECSNIAVGSSIFMKAYSAAVQFYGETPKAKQTALSAYNTGTFHRGFTNGYVERYDAENANPYRNVIVEIYNPEDLETLPAAGQKNTDTEDPFDSPMSVIIDFGPTADKALKPNPDLLK